MKVALIAIGIVLAIALLDSLLVTRQDAGDPPDLLAEHVPSTRFPVVGMAPTPRNDKSAAHWQK
ncbi:hypothetical protein [Rhodocyclus tenuis]|uniref:Uncharacterized protein n=1 Tax=Rhodocyclus tenuis TaxID=1066 RepID=A0A840G9E6_RHOTE|nr:hypothetical protein [Rhodocyclus tenuis]MBB4248466.1 hypothetical protein [Rhodocyclus tenuis]